MVEVSSYARMKGKKRSDLALEAFRDKEMGPKALILPIKSGSHGLNLVRNQSGVSSFDSLNVEGSKQGPTHLLSFVGVDEGATGLSDKIGRNKSWKENRARGREMEGK